MNFKLLKMQGAGNDFLIMDYLYSDAPTFYPKEIQFLCDRHFGVGADGMVILEKGTETHAIWRFYNSDGSEAEMCGNAARCVIRYLNDKHFPNEAPITIKTKAGIIKGKKLETKDQVEIALFHKGDEPFHMTQMAIKTEHHTYDVHFVNTGVPHAVIEVKDIYTYPINQVGKELLKHPAFGDAGTNVTFYQRLVGSRIRSTTFERGVEGETFACGTGVAAAAIVFAQNYMEVLPIDVVAPGGELRVELSPVSKWVLLQGPADYVFQVELEGAITSFEKPRLYSDRRRS